MRTPDAQLLTLIDTVSAKEPATAIPADFLTALKNGFAKRWAVVGLVLLAVLSIVPISSVIGFSLTLLGAVALALAVALAATGWSKFWTALTLTLGAIVLPWLALITFNFLLGWLLRLLGLGLWSGLVLAGLVFAGAAFAYLAVWQERRMPAAFFAVVLGAANVVGVPLLVAAAAKESPVAPATTAYVSKLDLAILVPATPLDARPLARPPASGASDWDVRWSVARVGGATPGWLTLSSADPVAALAAAGSGGAPLAGAPTWRDDADHVVLLDVDATPPAWADPAALPTAAPKAAADERAITRWLADAKRLAPGASVAVLLRTTDRTRLARWRRRVEAAGGTVASAMTLGGHSLTEAAQLMAIQAPDASDELALATHYRPILLFDDGERQRSPLDVDDVLASGRVALCHDDQLNGTRCATVLHAADLRNGATHLKVEAAPPSARPIGSVIYVHPTSRREGDRELLYLDYWWFLDDNPAKVGDGATCGVGLAMPGITCFDHPSDWEGMTVVLDRTDGQARPVAVQYAEHKDVVRHGWTELQAWWSQVVRDGARRSGLPDRAFANLKALKDVADHPIAFVGRGTHATYARPCAGHCHQTLSKTVENPYGGQLAWRYDDTAACAGRRCVRLLPTRHGGRDAALWNAYTGVWGDRSCILNGGYCTSELSPGSPSTQPRYQHPERITGWVDAHERAHHCVGKGPACPPLPEPAA
jgi:hypothetical protein